MILTNAQLEQARDLLTQAMERIRVTKDLIARLEELGMDTTPHRGQLEELEAGANGIIRAVQEHNKEMRGW